MSTMGESYAFVSYARVVCPCWHLENIWFDSYYIVTELVLSNIQLGKSYSLFLLDHVRLELLCDPLRLEFQVFLFTFTLLPVWVPYPYFSPVLGSNSLILFRVQFFLLQFFVIFCIDGPWNNKTLLHFQDFVLTTVIIFNCYLVFVVVVLFNDNNNNDNRDNVKMNKTI